MGRVVGGVQGKVCEGKEFVISFLQKDERGQREEKKKEEGRRKKKEGRRSERLKELLLVKERKERGGLENRERRRNSRLPFLPTINVKNQNKKNKRAQVSFVVVGVTFVLDHTKISLPLYEKPSPEDFFFRG